MKKNRCVPFLAFLFFFIGVCMVPQSVFASSNDCIPIDDERFKHRLHEVFSGDVEFSDLKGSIDPIDESIYGWISLVGGYGVDKNEEIGVSYLLRAFNNGSAIAGLIFVAYTDYPQYFYRTRAKKYFAKYEECNGSKLIKLLIQIETIFSGPPFRDDIKKLIDEFVLLPGNEYYLDYYYAYLASGIGMNVFLTKSRLTNENHEELTLCANAGYSACTDVLSFLLQKDPEMIAKSNYWGAMDDVLRGTKDSNKYPDKVISEVLNDLRRRFEKKELKNQSIMHSLAYCDFVKEDEKLQCIQFATNDHEACFMGTYGYYDKEILNKSDLYKDCRNSLMRGRNNG